MSSRVAVLLLPVAFLAGGAVVWFLGDSVRPAKPAPSTEQPGGQTATTITDTPGNGSYTGTFGLQLNAHQRAADNPTEAIKLANTIKGREQRMIYLEGVWEAWAAREGQKAADWAKENLSGVAQSDAMISVARGWASEDPAGAADWFAENTSGMALEDSMWEILSSWGQIDPEQALVWSEKLDSFTKSGVMDALAEGWGATDPRKALEAGMKMQDKDYGDEFVMTVAGEWASQAPADAAAWAETLEPGDLRLVSVHAISSEWALSEPVAAANWVLSLPEGRERNIASQGMALGWSEHDPGGALLWTAENLPDSNGRQAIIEDVMLNWAGQSPNEAGEWLNENTQHPAIDDIITSFTSSILDQDPEAAVAWTQTIQDPQKKNQHLERILKDWISLEPQEARNWISSSNLSDELKNSLGN